MLVILSEAKDLCVRRAGSFASLRMTSRADLNSAHGKSSLQMSMIPLAHIGKKHWLSEQPAQDDIVVQEHLFDL